MPTYDDYVDEGLFERYEEEMNVDEAKNSDDIIRKFRYFQNHPVSAKQAKLLIKYSRKHGLKVKSAYERIHEKVREGKSANQILRELKREGVGIRRQKLFYTVRTIKGKSPKRTSLKHTPKKYRKRST
jgi:hypothetical protein